jgi:acetylornithine deacetylase/succinyl-diaminopimelate desuccinylase-like protein
MRRFAGFVSKLLGLRSALGGRPDVALGLLLAAAAAFLPGTARAIWPFRNGDWPDPAQDLRGAAAALLSQAIRFPTVNPPGDELPLAEWLAKVLRSEGVEAKVVETPSGDSKLGRGALWARVPGTGKRRPVILHSHLDVVPAEPSEWAVGPFEGVTGGGYVVGRGALDAKGITIVHLLTLLELARRETPLDRDVILLATPDEEMGGRDGAGWIVANRRSLLLDAEFLLTEGGGVLVDEQGGRHIWGVAVSEKPPCWLRLVARGTPGHSSAEPRDAAVPRLVAALERVRNYEGKVEVVPEIARMFAALAPYARPEDKGPFANLANALAHDPAFAQRFLADRGQAALVRNTVTITVLQGGPKTNVMPAEAYAELDARLLPGDSCERFAAEMHDVIDDPGVRVETLLSIPARSSPAETELFDAIVRTANELDPGAVVVPRVIGGFTDAHWFRDAGIVAYGFLPRWLPPDESRGIHGPNERVSIDNLERGVKTTVRLLENLGPR